MKLIDREIAVAGQFACGGDFFMWKNAADSPVIFWEMYVNIVQKQVTIINSFFTINNIY